MILSVTIALLVIACQPSPSLSAFDMEVGSLIGERCSFEGPCFITIGEATSFEWDEMYVFRPGILNGEARAILPAVSGFKGEFNRKIAFLYRGKQVQIDEAPSVIEGEHTPPGMLFFDVAETGNPDCLRFSRTAVFQVKKQRGNRGDVYILSCANCDTSPVYAEFGTAINSQSQTETQK